MWRHRRSHRACCYLIGSLLFPLSASQQIDGRAFLLLTQRDIVRIMSIKLGPALKIYNSILMFKHAKDGNGNQSHAEKSSQSHADAQGQSEDSQPFAEDRSRSNPEDESQPHGEDRSHSRDQDGNPTLDKETSQSHTEEASQSHVEEGKQSPAEESHTTDTCKS